MAQRETFRVIPDRRRSSVGEGRNHTDVVFLIITTNVERLVVSQIEIQLEHIGVVGCRCWRVEAEAAGVDAIADGCVVRDVALRFISQEVQRNWVDARSNAIRRDVSCVDLRGIQTAETGWRACRTRRIACATRRAITNDALSDVRQRHDLQTLRRGRFAETFVRKEEERAILFDWTTGRAAEEVSQQWRAWHSRVSGRCRAAEHLRIVRLKASRLVAEEVVGAGHGVSMEIEPRAVNVVRAGFGCKRYLRAG